MKKTFKATLYTESYCFYRATCIKLLHFDQIKGYHLLTLSFVPVRTNRGTRIHFAEVFQFSGPQFIYRVMHSFKLLWLNVVGGFASKCCGVWNRQPNLFFKCWFTGKQGAV